MIKLAAPIALLFLAGCTSAPEPEVADTCGARTLQSLVGQPLSRVPSTPAGAVWRVTCTSCPVTMDYSERRLNIFYDQASSIVREVRCG